MKKVIIKIKFIIKSCICQLKYIVYKNYCKKNKLKQYVIFETPIHGNLGDLAIAFAEEQLLQDIGFKFFEVPTYEQKYYLNCIKKHISKEDIIFIHGGGFIGTSWKNENDGFNNILREFKNNKIIILPQTIFYSNDENGKNELKITQKLFKQIPNLVLFAREQYSYELAKKQLKANTILIPDIVLYLKDYYKVNIENNRQGILLCLRSDKEGIIQEKKNIEEKIKQLNIDSKIEYTDTVINKTVREKDREKEIKKKLDQFSQAKLIVTDRLHGMVFAALTKTPCIVLNNYNYKVIGVYEWIKNLDYIVFENDINNIDKRVLEVYNKTFKYNSINLNDKFENMKNIIKQAGENNATI